ncbi:uncharacterized protein [Rutidosis leptorrhynchoides]|uniref:uncharacterized protein n=1 Tax=Rutidosis leptorrhynchoides TaxID=125765 RepID=UPI003A99989C
MYQVVSKLKILKKDLNRLNWEGGNVFNKVKELKGKLKQCQIDAEKMPHDIHLRSLATATLLEYKKAKMDELIVLKQKAKVKWLEDGDRNTKFFHSILKSRKQKCRVDNICDENGVNFCDEQMGVQFVKHFRNFFGKGSQYDDKAPGPDGYSSLFFKKAWSIVGKDVCSAVKEFFETGRSLKESNATLIALIPKTKTPLKVSDFRPIACCNVLYKCISKVITNRLKEGLDRVVSCNQSAFIPRRSIHDNILVAQEVLKGYNRVKGPSRCALKIDIQKAYGTVNWCFLRDILNGFGFHHRTVQWIMECVTSSSFSICVNGGIEGFFKGGRGLRQGDPMSPYLFTLIMEVLSLIISKYTKSNSGFKYHYHCKKMMLTHICFADDLLVFCHRDVKSVKIIKRALTDFGDTSGLLPNTSKSTIFFGSVNPVTQGKIVQILPFEVGILPMKYLGVPLLAKRLGIKDLTEIDKLLKGFLWAQSDSSKGKAKVAWKNIWRLITKHDSLWSQWVNVIKLKGVSFLNINPSHNDSWGWKFLLKLREKVKKYVGTDHVNGTVKNVWVTNEGKKVPFSTHQVWTDFRVNRPKFAWRNVVWFKSFDPKHAFILWLAMLNRLNTQDIMAIWFEGLELFKIEACLQGSAGSERNNRLFRMINRSAEDICIVIHNFVQCKLLTYRVKHNDAVKRVARIWGLQLIDVEARSEVGNNVDQVEVVTVNDKDASFEFGSLFVDREGFMATCISADDVSEVAALFGDVLFFGTVSDGAMFGFGFPVSGGFKVVSAGDRNSGLPSGINKGQGDDATCINKEVRGSTDERFCVVHISRKGVPLEVKFAGKVCETSYNKYWNNYQKQKDDTTGFVSNKKLKKNKTKVSLDEDFSMRDEDEELEAEENEGEFF